jgi:hypothetical protein
MLDWVSTDFTGLVPDQYRGLNLQGFMRGVVFALFVRRRLDGMINPPSGTERTGRTD